MTLNDQIAAQWRRVDEEQAKLHDLQGKRDAEEGDELGAEWHRLSAISLRERTPEATEAEHRSWLVMMATMHLKRGTVPAAEDYRAAEIEITLDELRDAELRADRPSHSTEAPEQL